MKLPATFATVLIAGLLAPLLTACGGGGGADTPTGAATGPVAAATPSPPSGGTTTPVVVDSANPDAASTPDRQAESILAASKQASGGAAWDRIETMVVDSATNMPQGEVTFRNSVDIRTGRGRLDFTAGPAKGALGWDGKQAWTLDPATGKAVIETSDLELARRRTVAYQDAFGFYFPARLAARTRYVGKKSDGGASFDVISVTPDKGVAFEVWIDAETRLIARQVSPSIDPPQIQFYSDYREVEGVKFPFTARNVITPSGQDLHTSRIQSLKINVPLGDADFSAPTSSK